MEFFIILLLAFGAMWLMTARTRKQQKEAAAFRANLEPGQEVMTGSGMFGTIVAVEDDIVTLETAPGVSSRWLRPAIAKLVDPPVEDEDDDLDEDDDDVEDEVDEVSTTTDSGLLEDDGPRFDVPDDASSLSDPDKGEPRR